MAETLTQCQMIERSIIKKYRKSLWNPFIAGIKRYALIKEGDKIAVCISGGKDSMLLAKLMQQLHRHSDVSFELAFLVMDPGYHPENRRKIEENAALLEIPVTIFESDVFAAAEHAGGNPCYLCARMRRGHLYNNAQALGCNKIALGHHFSDVVETTLMGLLYGAQFQSMMPKLHSTNFAGMELIRPLYCVHEDDIIAWVRYNRLSFIQCACPLSECCDPQIDMTGARQAVKQLIRELKEKNPNVEKHIFQSIHMVNLDTLIGYKQGGMPHSFLDDYEKRGDKACDTVFTDGDADWRGGA